MVDDSQQAEDFSRLTTAELIDRMCSCGLGIPLALVEAIIARGAEAVPALCEVVSNLEWWSGDSDEEHAAVLHAMHLLSAIGDPAAVPALLVLMEEDLPSDFLTENMPGVLARLGPEAIPELRSFVDDGDQDPVMRSAVYTGLVGMAILHPELTGQVKEIGSQLAQRCLKELSFFPAFIGLNLAAYRDPADMETLERLCHSDLWDDETMCDWDDLRDAFNRGLHEFEIEHAARDPMEYFAPEEQARLRQVWREWAKRGEESDEPEDIFSRPAPPPAKVGRNEPCPCGSGKKYKRCCGRS